MTPPYAIAHNLGLLIKFGMENMSLDCKILLVFKLGIHQSGHHSEK